MDIVDRLRDHDDRVGSPVCVDAAREIDALRSLLLEFIEVHDEPCWRDHHGYCQAHFLEEDCMVDRARKMMRPL